jgi:hypothetical protein
MASEGPSLGTLLQLQLSGLEDRHLWINPQVTLFGPAKPADYRPFTWTVMECPFESQPLPTLGASGGLASACPLRKSGSHVGMMHLEVRLPLTDPGTGLAIPYRPRLGAFLVASARLTSSGRELEKLSGEAIRWYFETMEPKTCTDDRARTAIFSATPVGNELLVLVPLPFFFSRSAIGEKLPVRGNDAVLEATFASPAACIVAGGRAPTQIVPTSTKVVFESFSTGDTLVPQLIMQLITQTEPVKADALASQAVHLNFNQPVRRISWFVADYRGDVVDSVIKACGISLNGVSYTQRSSPDGLRDAAYFRLLSLFFHSGMPRAGYYSFSFALDVSDNLQAVGDMGGRSGPILYPLDATPAAAPELVRQPNGALNLSSFATLLNLTYAAPTVNQLGYHLVIIAEGYDILSERLELLHI